MPLLFKSTITAILILFGMVSPASARQDTNPDQFINYLKKDHSALAFTIPGWFVRMGGKMATRDLDDSESSMLRELTGHIRKLRFVVSQTMPSDFEDKFRELRVHMENTSYVPLIEARDDGKLINIWAKLRGNKIKRMVISVLGEDEESVFFHIKSNIDMDELKQTEFYQDLSSS